MLVQNLVKELSASIMDPDNIITSPNDWINIINFAIGDLSPEIMVKTTSTLTYATDVNNETNEADLSVYSGIDNVLSVYLVDSSGKQVSYDNWIYDKEQEILKLAPDNSTEQYLGISSAYPTIKVEWVGVLTDKLGTEDIDLRKDRMNILKMVCIRESLQRILLDSTKYDRYRTMVRKSNEYAILAIIRDYDMKIEFAKKKLINTNQIRTF